MSSADLKNQRTVKIINQNKQNNQNNQFTVLAQYYDILNYLADYKKVADYIEDIFRIYKKTPRLVLDLACGTGSLTIELNSRGYDMIGLDSSAEMLSAANMKSSGAGGRRKSDVNPDISDISDISEISDISDISDILWINQDMCDFELYGTVDAVVCCFDSVNYILDDEKIKRCFSLVCNYLNPGGLFIFDVNSEYKFENIYGANDIVLENKGVLCSWRNFYNAKSKICTFNLTLFVEQPDGRYARFDEIQREKYYSVDFFKDILTKNNFDDINIYYDFIANNNSIRNPARICFAAMVK